MARGCDNGFSPIGPLILKYVRVYALIIRIYTACTRRIPADPDRLKTQFSE